MDRFFCSGSYSGVNEEIILERRCHHGATIHKTEAHPLVKKEVVLGLILLKKIFYTSYTRTLDCWRKRSELRG